MQKKLMKKKSEKTKKRIKQCSKAVGMKKKDESHIEG